MEEVVVIHAANSLEMKAFTKMWEFESKDPVTEALTDNKAGSRKKEPTYLALGRHLHKYKKWLAKNLGYQPRLGMQEMTFSLSAPNLFSFKLTKV